MDRLKYVLISIFIFTTWSYLAVSDVNAQSAQNIAKLAKDFNVSPKMLKKFNKAGLSGVDLGNGLQIAKEVASSLGLDMNDAAEQVFSLKRDGKDWPDIAKQFDVKLPAGL